MNKTVALGYNLVAKDRQLINIWLTHAFGVAPRIVDLMNETYQQEQERAVVIFGMTAHKQAAKYKIELSRTVIAAEIEQLDPDLGDQKVREHAWFLIENHAKILDELDEKQYGNELTSSLPLERAKRELTSDELTKVKMAMELLDIREFELVPSHQTSPDRNRRSST